MADAQKNILVIGGAGFVGSHLCDYLVRYHNVICVDNFSSGAQSNIDHLLRNPAFEFIRHDITTPLDLDQFPELEKFQVKVRGVQEVYNLACPTSAKEFEQFRIQTLETTSWGVRNALEVARRYGAKFLHVSSSVVYGGRTADRVVFAEDNWGQVDFLSPRACYDEGRRFAETAVSTYQQVYGLDTKIVRLFRTYGPRMKLFDGQMIPDFITSALDGAPLVIYGDEHFTTSLVYIADVVDGIVKMMDSTEHGPVNLGSPDDLNIADVARQVITLVGSQSAVQFQEPLLFMTPLGLPDITRARELLGWIPVVSLTEGLTKTIDYTKAEKGRVGLN